MTSPMHAVIGATNGMSVIVWCARKYQSGIVASTSAPEERRPAPERLRDALVEQVHRDDRQEDDRRAHRPLRVHHRQRAVADEHLVGLVVDAERRHRDRLHPHVEHRLAPEPPVLRPPEADPVVAREHLARDLAVVGLPRIPQRVRAHEREVEDRGRRRRPRSPRACQSGRRTSAATPSRRFHMPSAWASSKSVTVVATNASVTRMPQTGCGRTAPATAHPSVMQKRTPAAPKARRGRVSWPSVVKATTRSFASSNVPSRSMTPHDAIATKMAPSGTPQRSCPGWPIKAIATSEASSAVDPPRTIRRGFPRARRRGGSGSVPAGPAASPPPPFTLAGGGDGPSAFSGGGSDAPLCCADGAPSATDSLVFVSVIVRRWR